MKGRGKWTGFNRQSLVRVEQGSLYLLGIEISIRTIMSHWCPPQTQKHTTKTKTRECMGR